MKDVFGPGDDRLIYVTAAPGEFEGKVYSIPVYGGIPRKLLDAVSGQISLSHDGTQIAFIRCRAESEGVIRLMAASIDGTNEREVHAESGRDGIDVTSPPAWSPDDSQIAILKTSTVDLASRFITVNVENGTTEDISRPEWTYMDAAVWTEKGLIVAARNNSDANLQLWQIISKDQPPRKLVNDLNDYTGVSMPRSNGSLLTVRNVTLSQLWSVALGDPKQFRAITHGSSSYRDVSFTEQGKLLYSSISSGSDQIWQTDLEDKDRLCITDGNRDNFSPVASSDGRFIYFISRRGGTESVYRSLADGSDAVKLTSEGETEAEPDISPDGDTVVFLNWLPGSHALKKVSSDGGTPVVLNARWNTSPTISPDGKFVAVWHADKFADDWKLALIDVKNGGDPVKTFPVPSTTGRIRWTADGTALLYIVTDGGVSNIWRQPINGGRPTKVTRFENDLIFSFDISPDGKTLVCERGTTAFDIILLSDAPA